MLPSGTITFLFTDIEGSTRLWEQHPKEMKIALARHDALLRRAIESQGGLVFKTMGDAFCAAFSTAPEALKAALAAQRLLQAEPWGDVTLRVRMALHTGAVEERDGDYFGQPLNRLARLLSAGYGGQMLISAATHELVRDHLPDGVSLHDWGNHRLRDLERPEHIYQVLAPDLPADFPPLKTLDNFANNLPSQMTSFIGREEEIADVQRRLASTRLLTLTGPGGTGKTRLTLQVAADLLEHFPNGVWFVELAHLTDARLVTQAVAKALGLREQPNCPLDTTLIDYLKDKTALIVLDNCEHLIEASAQLAGALLSACPDLKIMTSSREALGISGEYTYLVPSLRLPDPHQSHPLEALTQYEAVRLFIARAEAALPGFTVTTQNAPALAQICYRLDGIPLAIELAAARVKLLRVEQIAARLDDRFRLLTGGSRTAMPRQQTLKALIDWSWDLLEEAERILLRRLAIFVGGWTLEAAEAVCAGGTREATTDQSASISTTPSHLEAGEVLDLLTRLFNKSLVMVQREQGQETRYLLLETIRQYARDRLREASAAEEECIRNLHLRYFLKRAEQAEPELRGAQQAGWLDRLEADHLNVRAALAWALEGEDIESGLRLGGVLWRYWWIRGYFDEGRNWLNQLLELRKEPVPRAVQAKAFSGAGILAWAQGDMLTAETNQRQAFILWQEIGDKPGMASSLNNLGLVAHNQNEYEKAISLYEQSLAYEQERGNQNGMAVAYSNLGLVAMDLADYERARQYYENALTIYRASNNPQYLSITLNNLGTLAFLQGDYDRAESYHQESLKLRKELGNKVGIATSLAVLGEVAILRGNLEPALELLEESLKLFRELDHAFNTAWVLCLLGSAELYLGNTARAAGQLAESLTISRDRQGTKIMCRALVATAQLAIARSDLALAARLASAVVAYIERLQQSSSPAPHLSPNDRLIIKRELEKLSPRLEEIFVTTDNRIGQAMSLEQATNLALEQLTIAGASSRTGGKP